MNNSITTKEYFNSAGILFPNLFAATNFEDFEFNTFKMIFNTVDSDIETVEDFFNDQQMKFVKTVVEKSKNQDFKIPEFAHNNDKVFYAAIESELVVFYLSEKDKDLFLKKYPNKYSFELQNKHKESFPYLSHMCLDIMRAIKDIENFDLDWLEKIKWYKEKSLAFFKQRNMLKHYKENYHRGINRYKLNKTINTLKEDIEKLNSIIKNKKSYIIESENREYLCARCFKTTKWKDLLTVPTDSVPKEYWERKSCPCGCKVFLHKELLHH